MPGASSTTLAPMRCEPAAAASLATRLPPSPPFQPEWDGERGGNRVARLAAAAGSQRIGASIVELAPGTLSSPYHLHHANEELLIVLSGTPELRTPDGLRELQPGEVVCSRAVLRARSGCATRRRSRAGFSSYPS